MFLNHIASFAALFFIFMFSLFIVEIVNDSPSSLSLYHCISILQDLIPTETVDESTEKRKRKVPWKAAA